MFNLLAIGWEHYAFTIPLSLLSVFLMMVILVQRGRGGGLTGALGGMGGQSAFGTKAGDLFTRITVGVAAAWILLSMAALKILNKTGTMVAAPPAATAPAQGGTTTTIPASGDPAKGPPKTDTSDKKAVPPATTTPSGKSTSPAATTPEPATTTPAPNKTPAPTTTPPDSPATTPPE
jgi:preprotein translocase subunit SecG